MKLTKIFAFTLAAAALTACSDDDNKWNSASDVNVSMANTTVQAKEQQGMLLVPIKLDGEANGPVRVKIEVSETGDNPAINDFHMILTSDELRIPKGVHEVSAEFRIIDDLEYTGDRTFLVTIVSAEGAKTEGNQSTLVTIVDNDNVMYNRLQGDWKVTYNDFNGAPASFTATITGFDEDEPGYEVLLNAEGWGGMDGFLLPLHYTFNEMTNSGYLTVNYGSDLGVYEESGISGTVKALKPVWDGTTLSNFESTGSIKVEWDDDTHNLIFEDGAEILMLWFRSDGGLSIMDNMSNIKMSR